MRKSESKRRAVRSERERESKREGGSDDEKERE